MFDLSFMNDMRFMQGQTYTIQGTDESCKVVIKDDINFSSCHIEADRDISGKLITSPAGKCYLVGQCYLQFTNHYKSSMFAALPSTLSRYNTAAKDSNGRPSINSPEVVTNTLHIHFKPLSGSTIETTPDRNANVSKRPAITLSEYGVAVADLISRSGDTFKVLAVRPIEVGIDELFLLTM